MTDELKEALSWPDHRKKDLCRSLLAEFGATRVTERGDELHHSCVLPFGLHSRGDRSASASVNWRKLVFSCFVCGGGGLLWWVGACRGETGRKARAWLTSQTGLDSENPLSDLVRLLDDLAAVRAEHNRPEPMPKISAEVLRPWRLIHPWMTEVRGIPEENYLRFKVGFDPERMRIVIPHFWGGHLRGWQSRRMRSDGTPKYLSTPEFPRDRTLYCQGPERETMVVVESPMSVLRHWSEDRDWVATFGASVTDKQVRLLAERSGGRIILWPDADEPGWSWVESRDRNHVPLAQKLAQYVKVWVVQSPHDGDPADLNGPTVNEVLSHHAVPWEFWERPKLETI